MPWKLESPEKSLTEQCDAGIGRRNSQPVFRTKDNEKGAAQGIQHFRDLSSSLETIRSLEINSHTRQSADDLKSKSSPIQAVCNSIFMTWTTFTPGGFFSSFFAVPQRGGVTDVKIFGDSYATNHLYSRTTVQKKRKRKKNRLTKSATGKEKKKYSKCNETTRTLSTEQFFPQVLHSPVKIMNSWTVLNTWMEILIRSQRSFEIQHAV